MKAASSLTCLVLAVGVLALVIAPVMAQNDIAVGRAKEFIQLLQKGDYQSAYRKCDSNLGFKTTPEKWQGIWGGLVAKAGNFVEFKDAKVESVSGYTVVTQVIKFDKGHVDVKVALDNSMNVADFGFQNHKAAPSQAQVTPAAAPTTPST